ncbi:hypothetical protein BDE02_16G037700 [Populus trichocarpa]|nr:hypothetical protein BDE02_16G037700 [Populus trichocarpa]
MSNLVVKGGSRPPWVGLAAALWVEIAAGNAYNFPLYSPALKSVMGLNQQQLTMLGVANDIGENVGLLPGMACNKFPPWAVLSVGVLACFLGYGVLWLVVSQTVKPLPYWLLWLALVIATNSNAWFGTAVVVTNMRNFPLSRGTVSGILKGCAGISAAVYTVVYSLVLKGSASNLLLFLTLVIPILCLAMMYFIRPCTPASGEDSSEHVHFLFTQAAVILLAIYLLITAIIGTVVSLSDAVSYILVAIVVIFLISPLAIPVKMTIFPSRPKKNPPSDSSDHLMLGEGETTPTDPLLTPSSSATSLGSFYENDDASDVEILLAMGEGAVKKKRRPREVRISKFTRLLSRQIFGFFGWYTFLGLVLELLFSIIWLKLGLLLVLRIQQYCLLSSAFAILLAALDRVLFQNILSGQEQFLELVDDMCTYNMAVTFIPFALALDGILYTATALLGISYGFCMR